MQGMARMTTLETVGHLSFAIGAVSYWVRDELWLRGLLIVSLVTGIVYNGLPPVGPLWLVLFWLSVYVAINGLRIATGLRERRGVRLSDEDAELRETAFPEFTPVEFAKLMRIGRWRRAMPGEALTVQGTDVPEVMAVQNGELAVEIDGRRVATLKDGAIVGEISFIAGKPATATVRATVPTRYVAWPQPALRALLARNPAMLSAMRSVFSAELTRKLAGDAAC
jgi:Cyclic nucleotide-binding domain